jgi:predicted transcriptional regulator
MKKTSVINVLNVLPKEFSFDEFLERLIVIEKIEGGLKDVKEGRTVTHEEAKKRISKWLK